MSPDEFAKSKEKDQYETMKKRIRFMYENGNTGFIEILCSSKSIGEFLNNAEYISTISGYDRNMLVEFQKVVTDVENQEAELQKEYKQLQTMQDDLIAKQDNVNQLLTSKQSEIQKLDSELGDTKNKLAQLEAAAAAAEKKQKEAAEAAAAAKKVQAAAASKNTGSSSSSAGSPVVSGNGTFTHPCPAGYISSTFGYRTQPIAGASTNHKGIDFAAATGTPIYAATAGTVISAGYAGNAGNLLVINHGNGLLTYYMHCSKIYVSAGQKVSKGQNVAAVGTTGNSTGPHLHLELLHNGERLNPLFYFETGDTMPGGDVEYSSEAAKRLVQYALQFQGVPYVWGGYSPSGFDCSGFVSYCLTNSGVLNTGHLDCNGLLARMTVIPESEMQPGDIIFFQGTYATSGASHVGIYIGNGQMVHSGNPNKISDIYSSYFQQHWMCVARW